MTDLKKLESEENKIFKKWESKIDKGLGKNDQWDYDQEMGAIENKIRIFRDTMIDLIPNSISMSESKKIMMKLLHLEMNVSNICISCLCHF